MRLCQVNNDGVQEGGVNNKYVVQIQSEKIVIPDYEMPSK